MDLDQMQLWQHNESEDSIGYGVMLPSLDEESFDMNALTSSTSEQPSLTIQLADLNSAIPPTRYQDTARGVQSLRGPNGAKRELNITNTSSGVNRANPWSKQKTTCSICGLVFLKKTLQRHIRDKHGSRRSSFECVVCENKFKRQDILDRHFSEQHGKDSGEAGTVECVYCHQHIRERALRDHLKSQRCSAIRKNPECSGTGQMAVLSNVDSSYIPLSWCGLESVVDAETAICFTEAALFSVSLQLAGVEPRSGVITRAAGVELHLYEFYAFRGLAIRSLQQELVDPSSGTYTLVLLLGILEMEAFEDTGNLAISEKQWRAAVRANWRCTACMTMWQNTNEAFQRLRNLTSCSSAYQIEYRGSRLLCMRLWRYFGNSSVVIDSVLDHLS